MRDMMESRRSASGPHMQHLPIWKSINCTNILEADVRASITTGRKEDVVELELNRFLMGPEKHPDFSLSKRQNVL